MGYDLGKKAPRIKRHLAIDTEGLPHAVAITTANVTNREGALQTLERCAVSLQSVSSILADGGYTGKLFTTVVQEKFSVKIHIDKHR